MAITHTIRIKRRDDDPAKELLFEHTDSAGGDLGDLTSSDPFKVQAGDKIQWTSNLGNFSVLFKGEAPFNGNVVSLGGRKGETTSARVAKKIGGTPTVPVLRSFEYAATVIEGEPPVATTIDPLMELEDGGGGVPA